MEKTAKETSMSYDEVKKMALSNPLVRMLVRLSEIKIIAENIISYKGNQLTCTEEAFKSLARCIGAQVSFQQKVGSLLGDNARLNFMNVMREALSARKDKQLMFIGNPQHSLVVGVVENASMLSTQSFFDLTEGIIVKYGLDVKSCSIGHTGEVVITTTSKQEAMINGLPADHRDPENFLPGLAFRNSVITGTQLNPYTYRQVCTNGMIALREGDGISPAGFDSKKLKEFYERVNLFASNNFVDVNYNQRVVNAINTFASLGELKFAVDAIERTSTAGSKFSNALVPYYTCAEKYAKMGYNVEKFSKQQFANAKTNVPVWDVVNAMTNFASHDFDGIEMSPAQRAIAQGYAGVLLTKKSFDTANLMPSLI